MSTTWRELLAEASSRFAEAGVPEPEVSGRRIVEEASGHDASELSLHLSENPTTGGVARFDAMVARRLAGEPIQYVVGRWGFRYLDLFVDKRVLIPRPETEVVTGLAITEVERIAAKRGSALVADLGTGSGAIGLSVAQETIGSQVWITDFSDDALAVARANLAGLGRAATRVSISQGNWFAALPPETRGQFDVLVSNPPYVSKDDEISAEVTSWEPTSALFAGSDGLADLTHLIRTAPLWLQSEGSLVLEIGAEQGEAVLALATPLFQDATIHPDWGGLPRALVARQPIGANPRDSASELG